MHFRVATLLIIPFLLLNIPAFSESEAQDVTFQGEEFQYVTNGDCPLPVNELKLIRNKIKEHVSEAYYYQHFDLEMVHARDSGGGCGYGSWHWLLVEVQYKYSIDGYSLPYGISMEWDEREDKWEFTDFIAPREITSVMSSDAIEPMIMECAAPAYRNFEYSAKSTIRNGFTLLHQGSASVDAFGRKTYHFSLNLENGIMELCWGGPYIKITNSTSPIALYPLQCNGSDCLFSTSVTVTDAYIDQQNKSLVFELAQFHNDTTMTLQISRRLLDAKISNDQDGIFTITLDEKSYPYKEIDKTETHRTLMMSSIPADSKTLEILGTHVVQPSRINPSIAFDKPWYKASERAILTIIDPSINARYDWTLSNINTVEARVWSSVDKGGLLVVLRETRPDSGIFQEIITWDTRFDSQRLRAAEGGTINAQYNYLKTSANIISVGSLSFSGPFIAEDRRLGRTIAIGDDLNMEGVIGNKSEKSSDFLYIVQTRDSNGFTIDISTAHGSVRGKSYSRISVPWNPGLGDYVITIFLWSGLDKPIVLSDRTVSHLTLVSIDSHTAIKTAIDEDRWTEQALNAVNLREHFYFLKVNGELYSSDPYSRGVGNFLRTATKPADDKDHLVWGISMSPRLSAIDASWFYYVDDSSGKLVGKECTKISCDELGKIIEGRADFPVVYSYHALYNFNDIVGVFPMQPKLANSTISHRLETEVHCTENSRHALEVAASVTKLPSVGGYNYRSNIYYSDITNVMDVFVTDPTRTGKSLDQAVVDRIFRYTGYKVSESDFKHEGEGSWHYVERGHPVHVWTSAREDLGRLTDKRLSGACVWEEHEFGHIQYASFYTVLNQDIIEGNRKIGEIRLFVNEAGLMEISILSEKEVDPKRAIMDLFTKADLPLINVSDIKFEYSKPSKPS